jgi:hypothetical protein
MWTLTSVVLTGAMRYSVELDKVGKAWFPFPYIYVPIPRRIWSGQDWPIISDAAIVMRCDTTSYRRTSNLSGILCKLLADFYTHVDVGSPPLHRGAGGN